MNGTERLLNDVYRNTQTGAETVYRLLGEAEDEELSQQIEAQYSEFRSMKKEAFLLLDRNGFKAKGLSTHEKVKLNLMTDMQRRKDGSPSHIAEMLILGNTMGVIDAARSAKKFAHADAAALELTERLKNIEENNIDKLKKYL